MRQILTYLIEKCYKEQLQMGNCFWVIYLTPINELVVK
jgi:hypothetical protein